MFLNHLDDDLKVQSPIIKVFDMLLESLEKSCFENLWKKPLDVILHGEGQKIL
jgi:hypothetical protein